MKSIRIASITLFLLTFMAGFAMAASKGEVKELKIKTNAKCQSCADNLIHNLRFEKGVKMVSMDLDSKVLTVEYRDDKNSPENIRKAVPKLGFQADNVPAALDAAKKRGCCVPSGVAGGCCSSGKACTKKAPKEPQ